MKRYFGVSVCASVAMFVAGHALAVDDSAKPGRPPNIVILLADDLGYADIGFHGLKDLATPHIDSVAAGGVRFTSGYVSGTYCSPTRAGLATGRYQTRFGHEFNGGATSNWQKWNAELVPPAWHPTP
jgi:arylsulfatase A-like enzyme